jgi:hypothetical protein
MVYDVAAKGVSMANVRSGSRISGLTVRTPHAFHSAMPLGHDHDERGSVGTGEPMPKQSDRFRVMGIRAGTSRSPKDWRWVAHARTKAEAMAIGRSLSTTEWSDWKHEPLGHVGRGARRTGSSGDGQSLHALRLRVYGALKSIGRPIPQALGVLRRDQLESLLEQILRPAPAVQRPRSTGQRLSKKAKRALRGLSPGRKPIR